jgi:hypothetical protein
LKAEEQVEAQIFASYGPENAGVVSEIQKEAQVAMFVAQGMGELRQLSNQLSGAGEPDPLIQLKEQELQLRGQDIQRKAQEAAQKMQLQAADQQQDAQLAQQKIRSQEQIAEEKAQIARARLNQQERAQYAAETREERKDRQQQRK